MAFSPFITGTQAATVQVPAVGGPPALDLNFCTGVLDARVSVLRLLDTATTTNSAGVIVGVNASLPRFDYDPVTHLPLGLLVEELRVNLFLNSLIDGTSLSTQTVTVAAAPYTISFYGTGQIVLSGVASATVTGTGVYPTRKTLTFTPSAGALVCTVTGSVQYAQIEAGSFVTSFIPTTSVTVTRNADQPDMTGTNLTSWFNATEGTLLVSGNTTDNVGYPGYAAFANVDYTPSYMQVLNSAGSASIPVEVYLAGAGQIALTLTGNAKPQTNDVVFGYKVNDFVGSANGAAVQTYAGGSVPPIDILRIGRLAGNNNYLNGHLRRIMYWNTRLTNTLVQKLSA